MFTVPSGDWSLLQLIQFFGPRIFFAILCGGIIGLERELKNKPAGLKTNIMICLGAALYSSVSVLNSLANSAHGYYGDPSRISAQIVSGIGFLGGGTIIQARGTILGLTTAATIWIVAAIGICISPGWNESF
jgi:putative Mg2+ transporter-C (MgtC) family protein